MTGMVHLVGAGPGDPDLLTLKAYRILQTADVVLHDRLVGDGVLDLIPDRTVKVPVGKTPGNQHSTQQRILRLLVSHARQGRTVVRLKGGDPFVYGRGSEEWEYLSCRGIPVEVTPGLTSAVAVPPLAGIPLTHRGIASSFAVVTGRTADVSPDWSSYAAADTLVVLMSVANRAHVAASLISAGRPGNEPAAFIERGTTPNERVIVTTLAEVASGDVDVHPPAVFVIGHVVTLRGRMTLPGNRHGAYLPPAGEGSDLKVAAVGEGCEDGPLCGP